MDISSTALKYEVSLAVKAFVNTRDANALRNLGAQLTPRQIYIAAEEISDCAAIYEPQRKVHFIMNCLEYLTQSNTHLYGSTKKDFYM